MLNKHFNDAHDGNYIVVIHNGKVFLGHETKLSDRGVYSHSD